MAAISNVARQKFEERDDAARERTRREQDMYLETRQRMRQGKTAAIVKGFVAASAPETMKTVVPHAALTRLPADAARPERTRFQSPDASTHVSRARWLPGTQPMYFVLNSLQAAPVSRFFRNAG